MDKSSGITTSDKTEVRQSHKLSVSFDESTFSASTEEFYNATSTGRAAQDYAHQYVGSIEKGVLLENLSDGLVENTLAMLKFADATNYVDQAEAHFLEMMPMIANLDEESLNEFIRTYDVQASEVEEGIQISLTYSIADLLDEDEEEAGTVPADLLFDSEGDLLGFSYVFSDLISGLADEDAEIDEESTSFVVTGCLLHSTLDPIYVASGDEYTDPVQFINVFKDQALPRLFD